MKRKYIKPSVTAINIETTSHMMIKASIGGPPSPGIYAPEYNGAPIDDTDGEGTEAYSDDCGLNSTGKLFDYHD